jgi:hypothetical protein
MTAVARRQRNETDILSISDEAAAPAAEADDTFRVRWRRMVTGPQTHRRGKAGTPRSLRSWAPAFPFPEGSVCSSLGGGVSIMGLLPPSAP